LDLCHRHRFKQQFSLENISPSPGFSYRQGEQLIGEHVYLFHISTAVSIAILNLWYLVANRQFLIESNAKTKWSKSFNFFIVFSVLFLTFGPYSVERVISRNRPYGLVFAYGVYIPAFGILVPDLMATVFWYIFQLVIVLPFFLFVAKHRQEHGFATSSPSFKAFLSNLCKFKYVKAKKNDFTTALRLVLPFFIFVAPPILLYAYAFLKTSSGLLTVPSMWFVYFTWVFTFYLIGTSNTIKISTETLPINYVE